MQPNDDFQKISDALKEDEAPPQMRPLLLAAVIGVLVASACFWLGTYSQQRTATPAVVGPFYGDRRGIPEVAKTEDIQVHVVGAVRKPGVYKVRSGTSIQEAIQMAGGPTSQADTQGLNLADYVEDGSQIEVPDRASRRQKKETVTSGNRKSPLFQSTPEKPVYTAANPLNINTANAEEFAKLPKIGPATAKKILDYRNQKGPFRNAEDLMQVSGIGPKTYEEIRAFITVK